MDRIDKALFILPFLPLADMVSTFFSLSFGGQEIGILTKLIYEQYDKLGLAAWSSFLFLIFLVCAYLVRFGKRKFTQARTSGKGRSLLAGAIYAFFTVEALWMTVVIHNLLVPIPLPLFAPFVVWSVVPLAYFSAVTIFTRTEMKRLMRR